jgi:hypothetical protein
VVIESRDSEFQISNMKHFLVLTNSRALPWKLAVEMDSWQTLKNGKARVLEGLSIVETLESPRIMVAGLRMERKATSQSLQVSECVKCE